MNNSNSLGNIMTRLSGVKNVSGRRVMPGQEYLEDLDNIDNDVSGTSSQLPNFLNLMPPAPNKPEADMGGQLTSQSYDVRANVANPPDNNQYQRLGAALAEQVKKPEEEAPGMGSQAWDWFKKGWTPSAPPSATQAPPVSPQQSPTPPPAPPNPNDSYLHAGNSPPHTYAGPRVPETSPGFFGAVKDYASPTKRAEVEQYQKDLNQDAQLLAQGRDPAQVRSDYDAKRKADEAKALEQPWQHAAYGSAAEVANSPILQAEFKEITGMNFDSEIAAQTQQYEAAMQGVEDSLRGTNTQLDERSEGIKQRILNNQANDADKYYIGLALLMPLLIGGMFGKEAALGALGGGAKGIADVLVGRQKQIREDESSLLDINKQQNAIQEKLANIGLDKAKLGPALKKALPDQPDAHLTGMREINVVDPATGNKLRGVEIKPGLIARPEYVASKEGKADMLKAANELMGVKNYVKEIDDITQDVADIVSQLKDPTAAWKTFSGILQGAAPGSLSKTTEDVEFEGRKYNAGTLLEEKLGFLANAYGMAKDIGQLDRAAQNHIKKIVDNPTSTLLTPRDSLNQILEIRKLAQKGLVEQASNAGFYPEFIIKDLEARNNPLFSKLNKADNDKRLAARKKQALQSETNYAQ